MNARSTRSRAPHNPAAGSSDDDRTRLIRMARGAVAIGVLTVDAMTSRQVVDIPGVVTDVYVSTRSHLRASVPSKFTKHGGRYAGHFVASIGEPRIEIGTTYLAFFETSSRFGVRVRAVVPTDGTSVPFGDITLSLDEVAAVVATPEAQ